MLQSGAPVATFKHHTAPVTSVEWHPTDSTVFASAGADDQIGLWDLALEKDEETAATDPELAVCQPNGFQIESHLYLLLFVPEFGTTAVVYPSRPERNQGTSLAPSDPRDGYQYCP